MVGSIRNGFGMGSLHRSLAGAFGAALRYMEEYDPGYAEWRLALDMTTGKPRGLAWEWGLHECWIEEREVRP